MRRPPDEPTDCPTAPEEPELPDDPPAQPTVVADLDVWYNGAWVDEEMEMAPGAFAGVGDVFKVRVGPSAVGQYGYFALGCDGQVFQVYEDEELTFPLSCVSPDTEFWVKAVGATGAPFLRLDYYGPHDPGTSTLSDIVKVCNLDLQIILPWTYDEAFLDDAENPLGFIINVNIDDDDNDGGAGTHGNVDICSDKGDTDGVEFSYNDLYKWTFGDDDLVKLKLNRLVGVAAEGDWEFKLSWDTEDMKIKVWTDDHKRPGDEVESGTTTFDATKDHFVWVEGLSPSEPGGGEIITLKAYKDGQEIVGAQDKIKIRVAEMMFAIYGHGSTEESRQNLETYLDSVNGDDPRTDPYIIDAGDYCYSVYIWDTEKGFKIALQAEDSYVVFEGHTRFYFGEPADLHNLNQFMNVGDSMIDISLYRACLPASEGGFGYNLEVPAGSYGGETPNYGVWKYRVEVDYTDCDLDGNLKTGHFYATHFSLDEPFEGPLGQEIYDKEYVILQSWIPGNPLGDFHYIKEDPELPEEMRHRLVVDWGSADLPNLAYGKLFLNTCESNVYYNHFNQGTVFFTTGVASRPETTTQFFTSLIAWRSSEDVDRDILTDLNRIQSIHGLLPYRGE